MPEDLARFLQLPPYDNDIQINRKDQQEQNLNDDEIKTILEHAPCISINDHCPWNNDNRGKISFFFFVECLHLIEIYFFRNIC